MACIDGGQQARTRVGSVGHADDPREARGQEDLRQIGSGQVLYFDLPFATIRDQAAADLQRVTEAKQVRLTPPQVAPSHPPWPE